MVQPQDICTLVGQELHLVDPREHQDSCEGKRWLEPKAALEAVPLLHELVFLGVGWGKMLVATLCGKETAMSIFEQLI